MSKVGRVFVINLLRRRDRMLEMRERLLDSGTSAPIEYFRAIDSFELNARVLEALEVSVYPEWKLPTSEWSFHNRDIKAGEIACALSHYFVWRRIVDEEIGTAIILEDDVVFEPGALAVAETRLAELDTLMPDWDFCYLGRGRIVLPPFIEGSIRPEASLSDHLVKPTASYDMHAYALSLRGARKLIETGYLQKIVPLDEFVPALYARHPRDDMRELFGPGDRLRAAAVEPSLLRQSRKEGESDTELSDLVSIDPNEGFAWVTPMHGVIDRDNAHFLVAQSAFEEHEFEISGGLVDIIRWMAGREKFTMPELLEVCPSGTSSAVDELLGILAECHLITRPLY